MSPEAVVEASLSSLARNELLCIPGKRYRALYRLARLTPRFAQFDRLARRLRPRGPL